MQWFSKKGSIYLHDIQKNSCAVKLGVIIWEIGPYKILSLGLFCLFYHSYCSSKTILWNMYLSRYRYIFLFTYYYSKQVRTNSVIKVYFFNCLLWFSSHNLFSQAQNSISTYSCMQDVTCFSKQVHLCVILYRSADIPFSNFSCMFLDPNIFSI